MTAVDTIGAIDTARALAGYDAAIEALETALRALDLATAHLITRTLPHNAAPPCLHGEAAFRR